MQFDSDAVRLIFVRAREQQRTEGKGGMLAVACGREQVEDIFAARGFTEIWVAAINSPSSVTIAGAPAQIKALRALCKETYQIQSYIYIYI